MRRKSKSQVLRSRYWTPDGKGGWAKRGWFLSLEDAFALEILSEREECGFPSARFLRLAEVSVLRKKIDAMKAELTLYVSERDSVQLHEILENPPAPNEALRKLFEK